MDCHLKKWDGLVSCHKCGAQVDVTKSRIAMADMKGNLFPANIERVRRRQGIRPPQWVRLCLTCNTKEGRSEIHRRW